MIQHGANDEWADRENPAVAGQNYGPPTSGGYVNFHRNEKGKIDITEIKAAKPRDPVDEKRAADEYVNYFKKHMSLETLEKTYPKWYREKYQKGDY